MALAAPAVPAAEVAVVGATLHTGSGQVIPDAALLIRDGKIAAVGPRAQVPLSAGARVIEASGKHVTPGFIDLHSKLFLRPDDLRDFGGSESRSVIDALEPFDALDSSVLFEGVTTVAISPGTSLGAGGLGAVVKLRPPSPIRPNGALDSVILRESHLAAELGVSLAESTSAARLDQYHRLRGHFIAAREYEKSWDTYWKAVTKYNDDLKKSAEKPPEKPAEKPSEKAPEKAPEEPKKDGAPPAGPQAGPKSPAKPTPPRAPSVDVGREAFLRAMGGKLRVILEAHRKDDIEYALSLKEEFGLEVAILGATQASPLAERLAASRVVVAIMPVLLEHRGLQLRGHTEGGAAALVSRGVPVAITSIGNAASASRALRLQAVAAVRGGLPSGDALRAITSVPARILGLDQRLGTLEVGKDADLVLLSGDPMDARSRVELVAVDGEIVSVPPLSAGSRTPRQVSRGGSAPRRTFAGTANVPKEARDAAPGRAIESGGTDRAEAVVIFRNARVLTPRAGKVEEIEDGTVVVRGGRIEWVGKSAGAPLPPGAAEVLDLAGRWLLPGFIDAHSHAGIAGETDDHALAINDDLRVLDAFDPWDPEVARHVERGTTAAALSPGSSNVVGGRISIVKLVPGLAALEVVRSAAGIRASLRPNLSLPRHPTALSGALGALEDWVRGDNAARSLRDAPLVLDVPSRASVERLASLLETEQVALAILDGGSLPTEVWSRLEPPRAVILGPYGSDEPASRLRAAAEVRSTGAPIAFATSGTRRDLLTSAVLAMRAGLSRDDALLALTAWPAEIYGVSGRIGTIEPGADADLVVWSGDPFSLSARVELTFIDGKRVHAAPGAPGPAPLLVEGAVRAF